MDMHATLGGAIPTPAPACPHAPQTLEAHLRRWDRMPTQGHTGPRRLTCERVHLHPPPRQDFWPDLTAENAVSCVSSDFVVGAAT